MYTFNVSQAIDDSLTRILTEIGMDFQPANQLVSGNPGLWDPLE